MVMGKEYEELAARAFDEPFDREVCESMLVCADALGEANDPRGPLITMEHAMRDAEPRRALELRGAIHEHIVEHGSALLGDISTLMTYKRALELEWRAGQIYGVSIDARYLPKQLGISAAELVRVFLKAPAASNLRRLRVRLRGDAEEILAMLEHAHPPPLEELELGRRVWPVRISGSIVRPALLGRYPHLYYLAIDDQIKPLPMTSDVYRSHELDIPDVLLVDPPTTRRPRVLLGRALSSYHEGLRAAALHRIAGFGPAARVYTRVMTVLLQPNVATQQHEIAAAMTGLGPARDVLTVLAKVSSRPQYDEATRRAAGIASAALRARSAPTTALRPRQRD